MSFAVIYNLSKTKRKEKFIDLRSIQFVVDINSFFLPTNAAIYFLFAIRAVGNRMLSQFQNCQLFYNVMRVAFQNDTDGTILTLDRRQ